MKSGQNGKCCKRYTCEYIKQMKINNFKIWPTNVVMEYLQSVWSRRRPKKLWMVWVASPINSIYSRLNRDHITTNLTLTFSIKGFATLSGQFYLLRTLDNMPILLIVSPLRMQSSNFILMCRLLKQRTDFTSDVEHIDLLSLVLSYRSCNNCSCIADNSWSLWFWLYLWL